MSRTIHILSLLAILVYWSPVRSCLLQEWTVGASCHDVESVDMTSPLVDAQFCSIATSDGNHSDGCLCEQPKLSAGRSYSGELSAGLTAPVAVPTIQLASAFVGNIHDRSFDPPDVFSFGRTLPLLN